MLQRALQVGTTGLLGPGPLAQLQHAAGNAAVAQLLQSGMTTVQRDAEAINVPIADGAMGFSPKARLFVGGKQAVPDVAFTSDAPLPFASFQDASGNLANRTLGSVQFDVPVSWSFPPGGNRPEATPLKGHGFVRADVPFILSFTANPTPKEEKQRKKDLAGEGNDPSVLSFTFQQARYPELFSTGGGANLVGAPVTTDSALEGGAVTITPTIQFQEQLSHATQDQTSVSGTSAATPAGLPTVTIGEATGTQDQSQVNVTDTLTKSFTALLKLDQPKPPPVATEFGLDDVGFAVDSDSIVNEEQITNWYQGEVGGTDVNGAGISVAVSDAARAAIESGKAKINLLGKASATASYAHNRKLAHRRVDKVKDILSDLAGSEAQFHTQAIGRSKAKKKGEAKEERVVEIRFQVDVPGKPTTTPATDTGAEAP